MNGSSAEKASDPQASNRRDRTPGEDACTTYVESGHWTAILDSISELKDSLEEDLNVIESGDVVLQAPAPDGPDLLFGGYKHIRKQNILAAIPPRSIVDRLVSKCFTSVEIAPVILHSPTFLDEYERFWDNPHETPTLWIGLLFGIMCLGVLYQQLLPDESALESHSRNYLDAKHQIQIYREKTAQCLILGNYIKSAPFAIETLLLYMHAEYLRKDDTATSPWVLLGIIVRLALRMGYHRDAAQFSRITPFQAEMRRRVWAVIFMMDALASGQFGLPRMVRASQSNVEEPRSLLDSDIREDMTELPAARPEEVQTPVRYIVAKNKLIAALGKISDLDTLAQRPVYAEILRLDGILHKAHDSIPQWLTMRPMTKSIIDSAAVITQRIYVVLIFYRAKCTLHRPYLLQARNDKRYMYSRTACIEAACEILNIQQILGQETQVGGRLHDDRGLVLSLVKSDFILASTILCVDVNQNLAEYVAADARESSTLKAPSEDVLKALDGAYRIWVGASDSSQEVQQAARVLRTILDRVQQMETRTLTGFELNTASGPTTRKNANLPSTLAGRSHISDSPNAMNAGLVASNPMFVPDLPGKAFNVFADFSEIDYEMVSFFFFQQPRRSPLSSRKNATT